MTRTTFPRLTACFGLLLAVSGVFAQVPGTGTELAQYRDYLLKGNAPEPKDGAVKVTFLGTTTLLFDDGETQLMVDGFFSRPPLFKVLAGKIETDTKVVDAALKRAGVERLKAIFVAHSHYDHALDAPYVVQKTKATLHGSASTLNIGRGGDLREEQMVLFEVGKEYTVGKFAVTVLKSKHSPPIPGINDDLGQTIDKPLKQPASFREYKEGGAYDFLIKRGGKAVLVNIGANYIEGALDKVRADVYFLSVGGLGMQTRAFQNAFYDQTVKKVRPQLVIPIHWDHFLLPLDDRLTLMGDPAFEFLIGRLKADGIRFGIMQGFQSVELFGKTSPEEKAGK
jgi:L-ascorbate metabolism protein UlaG (beta-lactamase superfamily)